MVAALTLGTPNAGIGGATTYVLPSHQADDILVLATETDAVAGLTAPTNWANTGSSPRAQGTNVTTVNAFYKRATSSAETNPQVPASANHQDGIPFRLRGCLTSGNFWDASAADGQVAGTTGRVFDAAFSTVTTDSLVVYMLACGADTATDNFVNIVAPGELTGWTVHDQNFTANGNGGGMMVASGVMHDPGSLSNLTWDFTLSAAYSGIVIAVPPALIVTSQDFDSWGALMF